MFTFSMMPIQVSLLTGALLLVGEVAVPSSDDVTIHLRVFQVTSLKSIDLPLKVGEGLL